MRLATLFAAVWMTVLIGGAVVALSLIVTAATPATAVATSVVADAPMSDAPAIDPRFERLRSLVGTWTGKAGFGEPTEPTTITYRLTGGGTALMEILFEGTPHEMTTIYHMDGPDLVLTHYCAAGNQPRMKAVVGSDPSTFRFDFAGASNLKSPLDHHMHAAMLQFDGPDHLRAVWYSYAQGKPAGEAKFDVTRVRE